MRALSLTDPQCQMIHEAARPIPIEWRGRFIEACADRLLPLDVITNDAVAKAVHYVITAMFASTGSVA